MMQIPAVTRKANEIVEEASDEGLKQIAQVINTAIVVISSAFVQFFVIRMRS